MQVDLEDAEKKEAEEKRGQCANLHQEDWRIRQLPWQPPSMAKMGHKLISATQLREVATSSKDPPSVGVMGRNKDSGIVWSPAHIFKYLVNRKKHIHGTKMFFAGIKKEKERADLIAFLHEAAQVRYLSSSSSFVVAWRPSMGFD